MLESFIRGSLVSATVSAIVLLFKKPKTKKSAQIQIGVCIGIASILLLFLVGSFFFLFKESESDLIVGIVLGIISYSIIEFIFAIKIYKNYKLLKNNKFEEALSILEKEVVGEWFLRDALMQEDNNDEYKFYPNCSSDFNALVRAYYNKATLIFYSEKSNGWIKGELKINNSIISTFYWVRLDKETIDLKKTINMYYSTGVGKKLGEIDNIYISNDCSCIAIAFEDEKVFYYFRK